MNSKTVVFIVVGSVILIIIISLAIFFFRKPEKTIQPESKPTLPPTKSDTIPREVSPRYQPQSLRTGRHVDETKSEEGMSSLEDSTSSDESFYDSDAPPPSKTKRNLAKSNIVSQPITPLDPVSTLVSPVELPSTIPQSNTSNQEQYQTLGINYGAVH